VEHYSDEGSETEGRRLNVCFVCECCGDVVSIIPVGETSLTNEDTDDIIEPLVSSVQTVVEVLCDDCSAMIGRRNDRSFETDSLSLTLH
jgi:hypothetical protein